MSLINEALKRARDEAVRREASSKRIPLAPGVSTRERNRWVPITVLALTVALIASLVAVVNLSSKLPDGAPSAPTVDSARPEPATKVEMEPALPRMADTPATTPEPKTSTSVPSRDDTATPTTAPSPTQELPPLTPEADTASKPKIIESPLDSVPPEQATSSAKQTTDIEARVFVRHAQLASGRSVDLGGIAWSEAGPYALLNGRVVGVGESVQGYRVSEIDPRQVILERDKDRVILRLK